MRTIVFWALALVFVCFVLGGCQKVEQRTGKFNDDQMADFALVDHKNLPEPSGGVVLSVGDDVITAEEIIGSPELSRYLSSLARQGDFSQFMQQGRGAVSQGVLNKTVDLLLYQMARKNAPDSIDEALETAVESEVNRFVADYDNNYAVALKEIKRRGLVDWEGYRTFQKRMLLTQSYMAEEMKDSRPISRDDMLAHYALVKDEQFKWESEFQFSLIDIVGGKLAAEQVKAGETSSQAADRVAREVLEKLKQGGDFAGLAREYSNGVYGKKGGKWDKVGLGSLASPYDVLEVQAKNVRPGQVVGPIAAGEGRWFIMKLESYRQAGVAPFSSVEDQVKAAIAYDRRRARYDALVKDLIEKANVRDMQRFVNYCMLMAYKQQ